MGSIRRQPRNPKRWEARYRDPYGGQRTKTFNSRASAKAWLALTESRITSGTYKDPRSPTTRFDAVSEAWLKDSTAKRESSIARDESALKNHILPAFGKKAIGSITRSDVQRLVNHWSEAGTPWTVRRQFTTLQSIFTYAINSDIISKSPCRAIQLPSASPKEAKILEAVEIEKLAMEMGDLAPMVYLAAMGMRWGEIAGLKVGSIDFKENRITIDGQLTRGIGGKMVEAPPKTAAGIRSFVVPDWMTEMLCDYLEKRTDRRGAELASDAYFFVGSNGGPLEYSNWRSRIWIPALSRAGISGLSFHDLRHTAATALVEEGVDIRTAQARLGHSSPVTTLKIYAQVTEKADHAAAEQVGKRFQPSHHMSQSQNFPMTAPEPLGPSI